MYSYIVNKIQKDFISYNFRVGVKLGLLFIRKTRALEDSAEDIITAVWGIEIRGSAVGMATGYGLDDGGVRVRVPVGSRIFPTSAEVNGTWIYIHSPIRLHGVALSYTRGQLHFLPEKTA
jgi:hypothetical protein